MKTIDRNMRGLGSRPFAAFLLLGLLGFSLDLALSTNGNYAENNFASVVEYPFLTQPAFAAENADGEQGGQNSSQTSEAKARLLFKKNESSTAHLYWMERFERFGRFTQ
jgi:hypothetical protein